MDFAGGRDATILHADLDSFYASVEQRDDPSLRGRPVIVGGGVVLAASYEAKAFGVQAPMGGRQALRLCPSAVVVAPRMGAYAEASRAVFSVFHDTTPLVEGLSIDEAFLEVGGLRRVSGTPVEIARRLRQRVRDEVGLPITVGVARTKFLAKVASAVAKPDGLLLVPPDGELAFLHPLPVSRLWGVGPKTAAKLEQLGVRTVADVARLPAPALEASLGPHAGNHLHCLAHGLDPRPVVVGRRRRSVGSQHALGGSGFGAPGSPGGRRGGTVSHDAVDTIVVGLVDRVTRRLREDGRAGRTVMLRLRFGDFTRATRSFTLPSPTAHTATVLSAARGLVAAAWPLMSERGVTLVGISVANLDEGDAFQPALEFDSQQRTGLDAAMDSIKQRFGSAAVTRAVLLGRDLGQSVPLLRD